MRQFVFWLAIFLCLSPAGHALADTPPTQAPPLVSDSLARYWEQSLSGGPGKDGIPSIDDPQFVSAEQADAWLDPGARIIGVYQNGQAKAYPQSIMVWHEIVNDTVGGRKLSITYCPLTGTALGFARGETEFGVSGRLVNSNLIMYDRATDSHWPQILAAAVQGPHKGRGLTQVRVFWTTWARWRGRHPDTRVLSRDTGYMRNYRDDPYGSYNPKRRYYAENSSVLFPLLHESDLYPPKREVFGFRTAEAAVAVNRDALAENGILRYRGSNADFLILHDPGLNTGWVYRAEPGRLPADEALQDLEFTASGPQSKVLADHLEPVPGFDAMWFAWYAFYPNTVLLDGDDG